MGLNRLSQLSRFAPTRSVFPTYEKDFSPIPFLKGCYFQREIVWLVSPVQMETFGQTEIYSNQEVSCTHFLYETEASGFTKKS
ncbi:hypothetical protein CEXT_220981 [Caerostris extrusa]|uniref:Uncharacterized protein n=1 Tax=Caerostris extrusa TaxID=172846 RepID=A0AAV4N423_CAEEX|nr:hypothetical protein CEXT_220981 [Caerostris extrusa]